MRIFSSQNDIHQAGFSLVELLVIAFILSVIATAVLIALNPVEIRRRSRDAVRLQDAQTLHTAILRYESGENCFPWQKETNNTCNRTQNLNGAYIGTNFFSSDSNYNLSPLIDESEVKDFILQHSSLINSELYLSYNASVGRVSICFTPESTAARSGSMGSIMNVTNTAAGTCDNSYAKNESNCNVCIPQL